MGAPASAGSGTLPWSWTGLGVGAGGASLAYLAMRASAPASVGTAATFSSWPSRTTNQPSTVLPQPFFSLTARETRPNGRPVQAVLGHRLQRAAQLVLDALLELAHALAREAERAAQ